MSRIAMQTHHSDMLPLARELALNVHARPLADLCRLPLASIGQCPGERRRSIFTSRVLCCFAAPFSPFQFLSRKSSSGFHRCRRAQGFLCCQASKSEAAVVREITLCTANPRLASIGRRFFLRLSGGFSSSTKPSAGLIPELTLSCVSRRPFAFLSSPFAALLVQVFFRFLAVSLLCCFSPPVALASLLLQAALRVSPEGNWESLLFKSAPWAWPLLRSRIVSFSCSWVGLSI